METVGDKYMTVSGLPEPCTHHAKSICHLALDMMEIAGQVKVDEDPVQVITFLDPVTSLNKKNIFFTFLCIAHEVLLRSFVPEHLINSRIT